MAYSSTPTGPAMQLKNRHGAMASWERPFASLIAQRVEGRAIHGDEGKHKRGWMAPCSGVDARPD